MRPSKSTNPYVAFLIAPAVLIIVFIVKIHVLDLPQLEAWSSHNHFLPPQLGDRQPRSNFAQSTHDHGNLNQSSAIGESEKEKIFTMLKQAGFDTKDEAFSKEFLTSLPKWSDITRLYGEKPVILGLETCQAFRDSTKDDKKAVLGVAGNFNSGTNFLYELIRKNCVGLHLWQVPWGKHYPAYWRDKVVSKTANRHYESVLPIVTVRDPYTWMQSQCRQPYNARFDHNKSTCPNIIPYDTDILEHRRYAHKKYVPIHVTYSKENYLKYKFESLPHFWNGWNDEYVGNRTANFPRLVVRLEDLVFHGEEVISQICECGGFKSKGEFKYKRTVANWNNGIDKNLTNGAGLLQSIIKYGNPATRRKGYTPCQLWAAKDILDPRLMDAFGYHYEDNFGPDPKAWDDCFAYMKKK